jgi:hypothetical protein
MHLALRANRSSSSRPANLVDRSVKTLVDR